MPLHILIVDANAELRETLATVLRREQCGAQVTTCPDARRALRQLERENPHLILIDYRLPCTNGFVTTVLVKAQLPHVRVILLLPDDQLIYHTLALACGADAWIVKARVDSELLPTVQSTLKSFPENAWAA